MMRFRRAFVRDLAMRHLPAIYKALHSIARRQGIELDETPIVNYVDLRGAPGSFKCRLDNRLRMDAPMGLPFIKFGVEFSHKWRHARTNGYDAATGSGGLLMADCC